MRLLYAVVVVASLANISCAGIPNELLDSSVLVRVSDGTGTGIVFKNGSTSFVWTCAHVVSGCQNAKVVIDPATGEKKLVVSYDDVQVIVEKSQDGRKIGSDMRLAKIIRYCEEPDLALLLVYERNFGSASAVFSAAIPERGDDVWHVGCFQGPRGHNSVSQGVVAAVGRLRRGGDVNELQPFVYDQVSLVAHRGSSGGGVFDKKSRHCIGMISEFLNYNREGVTHGALCITPSREIIAFARRTKVEFAVNDKVKVPSLEKILATPITVGDLPVPKEMK